MKFLSCPALLLVFALAVEAKPPQAPVVPQAPTAKKSVKRTCACDCGCAETGICGCGVRGGVKSAVKYEKVCGPDGCRMVPVTSGRAATTTAGDGCADGSCGTSGSGGGFGRRGFFRRR